jgi:hypothetical protein
MKKICKCKCHKDSNISVMNFMDIGDRCESQFNGNCCELKGVKYIHTDGELDADRYANACVDNVRYRRYYNHQEFVLRRNRFKLFK